MHQAALFTSRATDTLRGRRTVRHFLEGPALTPADLSLVLLVTEDDTTERPMPTVTTIGIPPVIRRAAALGLRSVKLFAESSRRDASGEVSLATDTLMVRAIRAVKDADPTMAVMTETCLCSYTPDGVCYVTDDDGRPDVPATIDITARQAVVHAEAGADIVGPASMVTGTVAGVRAALDSTGFHTVSIMPHVIFWSHLYDRFRLTMGATPKAGTNREFQIHPGKADQFVETALQMVGDGADMILLEPALYCGDVLATLRQHTRVPLVPFSVSGEYTALTTVNEAGLRDVRLLVELFTMLKRAGAHATLTYAALDIAQQLNA
ncbi:porphobilinogen synthase [Streptoalloteichus tenebrarius]|uniref:Delta-aminolevulinic acid dehydratase n=1 Tax=Streptoalloteichus tenebrarius (strain ATCC 17920 / DSM 40477 / JCM 4838 / CBS 697.72 / NBRC 16177 / NCIMB 11028 / NRRL B-12390 / A12253. 1 / ISP 5477) TaxID=1933 RepID=A0ABT1HRX0_STRSD|nr:hypothetical protein [Streptoalloteichus tenebrarius]MCP2258265.1 porphobilinogen synthase [Streptoalloteichus tenebrarius]BFF04505.1 porphobilinogen synthase [Streptoalloteichus tenebrarius]